MARRQWLFDTLRGVFEKHGFVPIQTPSFENLSTLTGKYGEKGPAHFQDPQQRRLSGQSGRWTFGLEEQQGPDGVHLQEGPALRPHGALRPVRGDAAQRVDVPFKRYQIQNVWRGDRPGKGRYQEFTQCDCDIIGMRACWRSLNWCKSSTKACRRWACRASELPSTTAASCKLVRSQRRACVLVHRLDGCRGQA